jgi:hypothetical protein
MNRGNMLASDIDLTGDASAIVHVFLVVQKDLIGVSARGPALSVANLKLPTSSLDEQPRGPVNSKETLLGERSDQG